VSGNSKQLSEEQLHIAEQQRIAGIIPNFYSSYDWNAPPMLAKHKFLLSFHYRSGFRPNRGRACGCAAISECFSGVR